MKPFTKYVVAIGSILLGVYILSGAESGKFSSTPDPAPTEQQKAAAQLEMKALNTCRGRNEPSEYEFMSCMYSLTSNPVYSKAVERLQREETAHSFGVIDRNAEYNQRLQDGVDRQDSRAMRQMESDARMRNRQNAENFRRGGR